MNKLSAYEELTWEVFSNTKDGIIDLEEMEQNVIPDIDYELRNPWGDPEDPMDVTILIKASNQEETVQVARVELYLTNAFDSKSNIFRIMDGYSIDAGDALIWHLLDSQEYEEMMEACVQYDTLVIGVLQEFFVFPEFRGCGMAGWINRNLCKLLKLSLNVYLGCLVTQIRPYVDGKYGQYEEKDTEMTGLFCRVMEKNGWRDVVEKIYIRDFSEDLFELA